VSKHRAKVGGNAYGSAIGQHNSVNNVRSFTRDSADRASMLATMRRELDLLPSELATKLAPYVDAIENEARKERPNPNFLEVTKNGLVEAAKTCAEMAPSLITAVGAVVELFSSRGG